MVLANEPSPSILFGARNMVSTLHDLQVWARALAVGTLLTRHTQRLGLQLSESLASLFPLANTGVDSALPGTYGLGIAGLGGMLGHKGQYPGYDSEMWYLPHSHGTVVVLLNIQNTACVTPLSQKPSQLLWDSFSTALQEIAFGRLLKTVSPSGTATCPVPARRPRL